MSDLIAFIRKEVGLPAYQHILDTDRLEEDLDLTGDEAFEFMERFFEHFCIARGDYEFQRYFNEEGFSLLVILAMPFSKKIRQKYDREPLTVGMLEQAVEAGVWGTS
ncbi:DUF1493 family protein [Cupriavidus campinensis]